MSAASAVNPDSERSKRPCSTFLRILSIACSGATGGRRPALLSGERRFALGMTANRSSFERCWQLVDGEPLRITALELEAVAGAGEVGAQRPAARLQHPVEQKRLNSRVIMEVLEMAKAPHRAASMGVNRWAAVRGELKRTTLAQRRHAQEAGDPLAAGHIRLQAADRPRREHPLEVVKLVAVLASGDVHPRGRTIPQPSQPLKIIGGDRLLKPADVVLLRKALRKPERLRTLERTVGIDVELHVRADRLPRHAHAVKIATRLAADLHLHPRDALRHPAHELLAKPLTGEGAKTAGAVHRYALAGSVKQRRERQLKQPRLQIPQRGVD